MRMYMLSGVSALVLATGIASANAADVAAEAPPPQNLWYVSLFGGASIPQKLEAKYDGKYSVDLNTGFVVGATIGRRINDAFRVEGELSYARYKGGSYTLDHYDHQHGPYSASGPLSATYLLANVWADVAQSGQAKVYVGGGLGAAYVTGDMSFDHDERGYGKGEWGFAGQLGAGVTYAVAQNIDLDFGYRFKAVTNIDFDTNNNWGGTYKDGNLYTHSLQVGLTAKF